MTNRTSTILAKLPLWSVLALIVVGCSEEAPVAKVDVIQPVKTYVITDAGRTSERKFPGVIDANQKVNLSFRVSGELKSLPIKESDLVKKGDIIAQLDQTDYKIVISDRMASYKEAEANYNRGAQLLPQGHISKNDYGRLEASYKSAEAALTDARQQLAYTTLKAPFSGRIAKRLVQNFEDVQTKQAIVELQDLSSLEVKIDIPENHIKRIRNESKPEIYASFAAAPDKKFPLTIKEFSTVADPQTQTFRATLGMEKPESITVFPGMTTSVTISVTDKNDNQQARYQIPLTAVAGNTNNQSQVWIVDETSMTVAPRVIEVGTMQGAYIEAISGIEPGERIVVAGISFLSEGLKVQIAAETEQAEPLSE
ncbi:MAG: efflux RND transporter periplasmic adaptor subunit [Motiliproteus sp.]